MSDEDLIKSIERLLKFGAVGTDEDIENNAFEYIKSQKHHLPNKFLSYRNSNKKAIFMAGGAEKSETALKISENEKIDMVGADDIGKICPLYSGKNSHLFQKASSRGVSILMNHVFRNNLSFILDGNFAEYDMQKENIDRAIRRNYEIEIVFVYRAEPDNIFETKYRESIKTTKKILDEFDNISFRYIDLSAREIFKNKEGLEKLSKLLLA